MPSRRRYLAATSFLLAGCSGGPATDSDDAPTDATGPPSESKTTGSGGEGTTDTETTADDERPPPTGDAVGWWADVAAPVIRGPALDADDGRLYVAVGSYDRGTPPAEAGSDVAARDVLAVEAGGGRRWRYEAPADVTGLLAVDGGAYATVGWPSWPEGVGFGVERLAGGERAWRAGGDTKATAFVGATADGGVIAGTHDDGLAADGERLFGYAPDGTERFAVESGDVFAGVVRDGRAWLPLADRVTRCVDATTGTTTWEHPGGLVGSRERLAVFEDVALVEAAEPNADGNYPVVALDPADGSERWRYATDPPGDRNFVPWRAARGRDAVFVADYGGLAVALDPADGSERWRARTGGRVTAGPTVLADVVVYATARGGLVAFETDGGTERWRHRLQNAATQMATHGIGVTVDASPDDATRVLQYDRIGDERFRFEHDAASTRFVVDDGTAYLGTSDGYLVGLDGQ